MNKTNFKDLRDTIADILIDVIASNSEACDTTAKIMRHVENALEAAYDKGRSEGYEDGCLECEQEYSERESYD